MRTGQEAAADSRGSQTDRGIARPILLLQSHQLNHRASENARTKPLPQAVCVTRPVQHVEAPMLLSI